MMANEALRQPRKWAEPTDPEIAGTGRDLVVGIGAESVVVERAVMAHLGFSISALGRGSAIQWFQIKLGVVIEWQEETLRT
jgi:hypothetical protein